MAWRAIELYASTLPSSPGELKELVTLRCNDWADKQEFAEHFSHTFGFIVAAFIYGGIHALAWNAHFRSFSEQLLWRISVSVVMGGLIAAFLLTKFYELLENDQSRKKKGKTFLHSYFQYLIGGLMAYLDIFLMLTVFALLFIYALARAYLVVECFINLSHLPAGAYRLPNWAGYFPHIS